MNRAAHVASAIGLASLCGVGMMMAGPAGGKSEEVPAVAGKEEQKKDEKIDPKGARYSICHRKEQLPSQVPASHEIG